MYPDGDPLIFPFLFGGTFIEGKILKARRYELSNFPSFSEGLSLRAASRSTSRKRRCNFPSFSEGLSLREDSVPVGLLKPLGISLPFRRDFH